MRKWFKDTRKKVAAATVIALLALVPQAAVADTLTDTIPSGGVAPFSAAVSPDGSRVYIGNSATSSVGVVSTSTNTLISSISLASTNPPGANMVMDLAVSPDGTRLYAVSRWFGAQGGRLVAVDTGTGTVVGQQQLEPDPFHTVYGVEVSPDGKRIYATVWPNMGGTGTTAGTLVTVDAQTLQPISSVPVGLQPRLLTLSADGTRAYVANANSGTVSVVDLPTGTVIATIPVGTNPWAVTLSPDGKSLYVSNNGSNTVSVIDPATNTVTATIPVGINPYQIAFTPDGTRAYVVNHGSNDVSVVDTAAGNVASTVPVGTGPATIVISPDGLNAYVGNQAVNSVSVIALDTFPAITTTSLPNGTLGTGYAATISATGRPAPTLAVTGGAPPPGLTLDPASGTLTGTPTMAGTYVFTVTASSTVSGIPSKAQRTYTIVIPPAPSPTPTPSSASPSTSFAAPPATATAAATSPEIRPTGSSSGALVETGGTRVSQASPAWPWALACTVGAFLGIGAIAAARRSRRH